MPFSTKLVLNVQVLVQVHFLNLSNIKINQFSCPTKVSNLDGQRSGSGTVFCLLALFFRPYRKFLTQQQAFRVGIIITLISCAVCSSVTFITVYDGTSRCTSIQLDGAITNTVTIIVSITYVIMFLIVGIRYTKVALTIRRKLIQTNDTECYKQEKRKQRLEPKSVNRKPCFI